MTDKLLKIVFIDKRQEEYEIKFLNDIYDQTSVFYKFIKSEQEIEDIIQELKVKENLKSFYLDNVLYVEGLGERLAKKLDDLKEWLMEDLPNSLFDLNENIKEPQTDEKDIIDKLAKKYRKEAEDKGKLN